jgi:hypothetical protein
LAEIIYSACIHFDSLLKEIAIKTKKLKKDGSLKKKDKPENREDDTVWPSIRHYKNFYPEFSGRRIIFIKRLKYRGDAREPFLGWPKKSPIWWGCYNSLKHDMYNNWKKKATFENAIQVLGALLICNFECEIRRNPDFRRDGAMKIENEFVTYPIWQNGLNDCMIRTDFFKYSRNKYEMAFEELQDDLPADKW